MSTDQGMKLVRAFFIFYRRLTLPIFVFSLITSLFSTLLSTTHLISTIGTTYILSTPLVIYFVYEINRPKEYFFYYNLGFTKFQLWCASIGISFIIGLTMIAL